MAIFNVERFKAELVDGGARSNQFRVELTFPNYVTTGRAAGQKSQFLVSAAELPGSTSGYAPVFYRGREVKYSGDATFAPFTCTVLNDTGFVIRNALEEWMNGIENRLTKTAVTFAINGFAGYQTTILVSQLDRNGKTLKTYSMLGAFPTDISPVGLDFAANDQISTFSVTLQYQTFLTL